MLICGRPYGAFRKFFKQNWRADKIFKKKVETKKFFQGKIRGEENLQRNKFEKNDEKTFTFKTRKTRIKFFCIKRKT